MNTPFDQPLCPTPGAAGNHEGTRGGHTLPATPAAQFSSVFTEGIAKNPGQAETPCPELGGTMPTLTKVKDAPLEGNVGAIGLLQAHQSNQTFSK